MLANVDVDVASQVARLVDARVANIQREVSRDGVELDDVELSTLRAWLFWEWMDAPAVVLEMWNTSPTVH